MKINQISFLLTIGFVFASSVSNYAQQTMSNEGLFVIEKKRIKSAQGEKLSPKDVEAITQTLNDPNINAQVRNARTQINIGTGIMVGGLVLELGSLLTLKKDNLGLIEFSPSSSALLIGGAAALLGGVIVQRLGFNKLKSAAAAYNNIKSGKKGMVYTLKPIVLPSAKGVRLGVGMRF